MEPLTIVTGVAVPLMEANIDTNQICPSRFAKSAHGDEWAEVLLHDRRYNADGSEKPDFVLNQPIYRKASILVADRNFGCGSSREGAVYAVRTFGIRCIIAPSFGDIFVGNCHKNGVLPIVLPAEDVSRLADALRAHPGATIAVNLPEQKVTGPAGIALSFAIHPLIKRRLVRGADEIALTMDYQERISAFESDYRRARPWLTWSSGA
jgi:3-isopropylmalate/(R)-2-methylmalate dehydratase small subunit